MIKGGINEEVLELIKGSADNLTEALKVIEAKNNIPTYSLSHAYAKLSLAISVLSENTGRVHHIKQ